MTENLNEYLAKVESSLQQFEPKLRIDDENREIVRKLSYYFSGNPLFETEGHGSLSKGVFLTGPCGVGKTLLMRAFMKYDQAKNGRPFDFYSTEKVSLLYQTEGQGELNIIFPKCPDRYGIDPDRYDNSNLLLDDLGAEPTKVSYMGTVLNPMAFVISNIYNKANAAKYSFARIHFTSNLNLAMLEESYGSRIESRLHEMVNFFVLKGSDRRKKK